MFGLFKSKSINEPGLGLLTKSGKTWNGVISFGRYKNVELRLSGDGKAPDQTSIELALQVATQFANLEKQIAEALFEHYLPYQDASLRGELMEESEPFPEISVPDAVWPHVYPAYVLVAPLPGAPRPGPAVEIACGVDWDEEHTIGARIQGGRLIELCGSV